MEPRYPFGGVQPKAGDPMVCNPSLLLWVLTFLFSRGSWHPTSRTCRTHLADCPWSPAWSPNCSSGTP